jgi:tetratricopeptide (TPR) repeat protein
MLRSSSNRLLRALSVGCFAVTLAHAPAARADESDDAIKLGVELRRALKDAEALEQFRRALSLRWSARALAQAGLAEQALGRWVEAERDVSQALLALDDAWIVEHRDVLNEALLRIREQLGTLELSSDQAGVEVWVGGVRAGVLPHTLRAPAGRIELEFHAPGQAPLRRSLALPAQQTVRERISFAAPNPPAAPNPSQTALSSAPPAPPAPEQRAPATPAPEPVATRGVLPWLTLGGAVAFVAGGVAAHAVRERAAAHYNDDERCFFGDQTRGERCGGDLSRARTSGTLAIVGYSTGALLGGLSAYLWLRKPSGEGGSRVGLVTRPEHALLTYEGRFGRSW